jgi:Flp pilus assembly pilin Flp
MKILKRKTLRGQAMTEYAVVATLAALVLIWSTLGPPPTPIDQLLTAIKGFYKAFSFAISLSA